MAGVDRFGLRALVAGTVNSLERRLLGALILIAISSVVLQFFSQGSALEVRDRSAKLQAAAGDAQRGQQLVELVGEFRIGSNAALTARPAVESGTQLTDIAIQIGEQVNALRLSGMPLYQIQPTMAAFEDLDRHVSAILATGAGKTATEPLAERNIAMADLASAIALIAAERRDAAQARLDLAVDRWHRLITITGSLTIGFVLVILFDLGHNILPALRRMHRTLRRLAAGELDFEVERFRLRELQNLSGPLETFRRNAQAVQSLAFTDPSTGMPNRRAFVETAARRLAEAAECGGPRLGFMLADIDRFKHVNDDFGHAAGDRLVKLIGERMTEQLGGDALIARVGGDEFAICVPLAPPGDAQRAASRLVAAMRDPFDLGGYTIAITVSLGTVEASASAGDDVNRLLHQADLALYAAKNEGRNRTVVFSPALEIERELERALERDLANALPGGELRLVYQPIHPTAGEENEVEALVRWRHPDLGEIAPSRFIPAAERSGLMVRLGEWIIERSLTDLTRWPDLALSINLSPLQLQQDGFVPFLLDCCRRNGIAARRVILEVTESLSIERNSRALLTLELLREAGFRIALDDFGTGYSSLCMMKTFKFDRLKLDRSLINDLSHDAVAKAVFDAAVTMALRIGAQVVAEGISDEHLVGPVLGAGCTHMQGFHFSRPIDADSVAGYFERAAAFSRNAA